MDEERDDEGHDYEPGTLGDLDSGGRVGESDRSFSAKRVGLTLAAALGVIVIVAGIAAIGSRHAASPERSSFQIPSDEPVPISMNFFGCRDHDYFRRMQEYKTDHDDEAFASAYLTGLATGQCIELKAGTPVYLVDRAFLSGLIQVRARGSTDLVWTQPSAVGMQ